MTESGEATREQWSDASERDNLHGIARLWSIRGEPSALSRNRNFAFFSDPQNLLALRAHQFLDRLGRMLLRVDSDGRGAIVARAHPDTVEISVTAPWLAARRSTFLTPDELAWMGANPALRALLGRLGVALPDGEHQPQGGGHPA